MYYLGGKQVAVEWIAAEYAAGRFSTKNSLSGTAVFHENGGQLVRMGFSSMFGLGMDQLRNIVSRVTSQQ